MGETSPRRSWPKRMAFGAVLLLLLVQLVPYGRDHTNLSARKSTKEQGMSTTGTSTEPRARRP